MTRLPLDPMDDNPLVDEPVFVVKPKTSRHPNARMIPENARLHGFDVQVHRVEEAGIYGSAIWQYRHDPERAALVRGPLDAVGDPPYEYVEDQVVAGFDAVAATALPIVGYNLFNYGWRVVATDGVRRMKSEGTEFPPYDFTDVIPRTIDLQDAIVTIALEAREADATLPGLKRGAFRLETLLEHNDVSLVAPNTASPPDAIGALWYYMVAGGEVTIDGHTHPIPEHVKRHLTGEETRYDRAAEWVASIGEHGWTRGMPVRDYDAIENQLKRVYSVYLAALAEN